MQVISRIERHYDAENVEFGRVYKWYPESVKVECDCGERLTLTSSVTTCCCCGADHANVLREEREVVGHRLLGDEVLHPWRYASDREDSGIPY